MSESITTRTPLADVDTSRFDLTIEKACALIDRLQAEKAELLAALLRSYCEEDESGTLCFRCRTASEQVCLRLAAIAHAEGRA